MPSKRGTPADDTTPERHALERALAVNLARLLSEQSAELSALTATRGLTLVQFNILRILRGAGDDALTCGAIGERLISREPDVTRLLDRMQKRGLVVRSRDQQDRRLVLTRLTPRGRQLLEQLDEPHRAHLHRFFGSLETSDLAHLLRVVEQMRTAVS